MKKYLLIVTVLLLGLMLPRVAAAQSTLTFEVNVADEITSGEFDPATDSVLLFGNKSPLSMVSGTSMTEGTVVDSVYTVTVSFPGSVVGENLQFRFGMVTTDSSWTENLDPPRKATLSSGERDLNLFYFDTPSW